MHLRLTIAVAALVLASAPAIRAATYLDLAPFAQITSWSGSQPRRFADARSAGKTENLGLEWDEERDLREIRVQFEGKAL